MHETIIPRSYFDQGRAELRKPGTIKVVAVSRRYLTKKEGLEREIPGERWTPYLAGGGSLRDRRGSDGTLISSRFSRTIPHACSSDQRAKTEYVSVTSS